MSRSAKRAPSTAGDPPDDDRVLAEDLIAGARPWDAAPASTGHQVPGTPAENEDRAGRSDTEQLVDAGVAEAERDQILQAARAAARRERGEP